MAKQDDGVVSKSKNEMKPTTTEDIKKSIESTIEKNQEAIESQSGDLHISIAQKQPETTTEKSKDVHVKVSVNGGGADQTKPQKKEAKKAAKKEAKLAMKEERE